MKSLILTTQDARELDKLGGLTITKPIKPAPRYIEGASFSREADCADIWHLVGQDGNRLGAGDGVADVFASPVEVSDVVFIREPWYRLKNPQGGESERVILAADSVVQPEQAAYKWASPVSMPQDAARRFARVKSIEPAYGENVTPAWLIELVAITKEEATAEDGAPLSTSDVPEEASSYYAYAGDMNAEDRDRMIAKIDADRARLAEVQDRLIRIDLRRRDLSALMFEERDKVDPNDRDAIDAENTALDEEQGDLAREEADLRAALEDAKAPAPTVEEHAREKYTNISAILSGPSDAIPTLGDYDALKVARAGFAPGDLDFSLARDGEFRLAPPADVQARGGDRAAGDHFDHILEEADRLVGDRLKTETLGIVAEKTLHTLASVRHLFMYAAFLPCGRAVANLRRRVVRGGLGRVGPDFLDLAAISTSARCDGHSDADNRGPVGDGLLTIAKASSGGVRGSLGRKTALTGALEGYAPLTPAILALSEPKRSDLLVLLRRSGIGFGGGFVVLLNVSGEHLLLRLEDGE